jgi:hypothetical protein
MDQRTEYVGKLSAQIVEWDGQIDLLKEKAENAAPKETFEYAQFSAALKLKRDQAAFEQQGISTASDDEWEELKAGVEQIRHEVQNILSKVFLKAG